MHEAAHGAELGLQVGNRGFMARLYFRGACSLRVHLALNLMAFTLDWVRPVLTHMVLRH